MEREGSGPVDLVCMQRLVEKPSQDATYNGSNNKHPEYADGIPALDESRAKTSGRIQR